MKTLYDVMQLLKSFGTVIYTGDRKADLDLMEDEIKELYKQQFISAKDFSTALLILRQKRNEN
ncbi:uncharacterized protein YqgQ [Planomicrobium soli]|uniref:Uncharacterized protein YqgQ n=1 Tax=Planomicrobium soli TaxID=1176648 RepID=A0A2P8H4M2_9BACL|nr:YqgQ family protein [Planomicrobium soli]PSL41175.1 uncharacterized protein YqgQ [Planomicrobium soli]